LEQTIWLLQLQSGRLVTLEALRRVRRITTPVVGGGVLCLILRGSGLGFGELGLRRTLVIIV